VNVESLTYCPVETDKSRDVLSLRSHDSRTPEKTMPKNVIGTISELGFVWIRRGRVAVRAAGTTEARRPVATPK
jgi:hypothetical protein